MRPRVGRAAIRATRFGGADAVHRQRRARRVEVPPPPPLPAGRAANGEDALGRLTRLCRECHQGIVDVDDVVEHYAQHLHPSPEGGRLLASAVTGRRSAEAALVALAGGGDPVAVSDVLERLFASARDEDEVSQRYVRRLCAVFGPGVFDSRHQRQLAAMFPDLSEGQRRALVGGAPEPAPAATPEEKAQAQFRRVFNEYLRGARTQCADSFLTFMVGTMGSVDPKHLRVAQRQPWVQAAPKVAAALEAWLASGVRPALPKASVSKTRALDIALKRALVQEEGAPPTAAALEALLEQHKMLVLAKHLERVLAIGCVKAAPAVARRLQRWLHGIRAAPAESALAALDAGSPAAPAGGDSAALQERLHLQLPAEVRDDEVVADDTPAEAASDDPVAAFRKTWAMRRVPKVDLSPCRTADEAAAHCYAVEAWPEAALTAAVGKVTWLSGAGAASTRVLRAAAQRAQRRWEEGGGGGAALYAAVAAGALRHGDTALQTWLLTEWHPRLATRTPPSGAQTRPAVLAARRTVASLCMTLALIEASGGAAATAERAAHDLAAWCTWLGPRTPVAAVAFGAEAAVKLQVSSAALGATVGEMVRRGVTAPRRTRQEFKGQQETLRRLLLAHSALSPPAAVLETALAFVEWLRAGGGAAAPWTLAYVLKALLPVRAGCIEASGYKAACDALSDVARESLRGWQASGAATRDLLDMLCGMVAHGLLLLPEAQYGVLLRAMFRDGAAVTNTDHAVAIGVLCRSGSHRALLPMLQAGLRRRHTSGTEAVTPALATNIAKQLALTGVGADPLILERSQSVATQHWALQPRYTAHHVDDAVTVFAKAFTPEPLRVSSGAFLDL